MILGPLDIKDAPALINLSTLLTFGCKLYQGQRDSMFEAQFDAQCHVLRNMWKLFQPFDIVYLGLLSLGEYYDGTKF